MEEDEEDGGGGVLPGGFEAKERRNEGVDDAHRARSRAPTAVDADKAREAPRPNWWCSMVAEDVFFGRSSVCRRWGLSFGLTTVMRSVLFLDV